VRAGQSFGPFDLGVSKTGAGNVVATLGSLNCGIICSTSYTAGTQVILKASPASHLLVWGGACSGAAASCNVAVDAVKSVTAAFWPIAGLPESLSFGTLNLGSSSAYQTLTLTNVGAQAYVISGISASGDFAASNTCGSSLAAGASCTVSVNFSPTVQGPRTGTLSVFSNAPGGPYAVALSGSGQGATANVNPSSLNFLNQNVTGLTGSAQTVTLSNTGGATLNIAGISISGDFGYTTNCSAALARSNSCTINVSFNPSAVGTRIGMLTINHDAATNNPITVTLSGTGIAAPVVALSPTQLNFAAIPVGSSSPVQTVTLRNTGLATLTFSRAITASSDFAQSNDCGLSMEPGAACSIDVTFKPIIAGTRTGTISFGSNAASGPQSVALTGGQAIQSINFGNAPSLVAGGSGVVSASPTSGLPVSFSLGAGSSGICSLSKASASAVTVTGLWAGLCTVQGYQAGDATWASASALQSFSVAAVAPSAPGQPSATPGPGRASLTFATPGFTGGAAITGYTASCTAAGQATKTASGAASPLVVAGLKGNVAYSCTVTASNNANFTSTASAAVSATPGKSAELSPILMLLLD